jgi:predicted dehydrogenase
MTDAPLRWGILSTARINQALIPALQASDRAELVAVASRDAERARAYAETHGIPLGLGSYEALLERDDIDVVYNPLPNHLHASLTIAAADAGKHVLCEKPLALTLAEVDAIAAAATAAGVVVTEAFMYRHHPLTLRIQEVVSGGAIGRPLTVRGSFSFLLTNEGDVRLDPAMGGGSLWDIGCYPASYARTVLGEPPIEAAGLAHIGPTGVDLSFWGALRFASGAVAQLDCSFEAPFRTHIEIVGTEGIIVVPTPFKPEHAPSYHVGTAFDRLEEVTGHGGDLYRGEVEDLADAVLLGTAPQVTLDDSRVNAATLLALLQSAREGGTPVPVRTDAP